MKRKVVQKLKSVELLQRKPIFIPSVKHRGSRKAGLVYEYKAIDYISNFVKGKEVISNPWFKYVDSRGDGWCSPDFLILGDPLIIGECKLTVTPAAERKLKNIYLPIVSMFYETDNIRMVQVAKNLTQGWDDIQILDINDAYDKETQWEFATLILRNV